MTAPPPNGGHAGNTGPHDGAALQIRLAVEDLYARQSHAIDSGDTENWALTFTPNGRFTSPTYGLTATGRQALQEFAATSNASALARGQQYRHWVGQLVCDKISATELSVHGYMVIIATTETSVSIDRSLTFVDRLHRVGDRWLVASRDVFRDGP